MSELPVMNMAAAPPQSSEVSSPHLADSSWSFQRSFSTPDAGQLHHGEDSLQPGGSGEKKRNKLGYNRTSVACSNCRKRKIRCVPTDEDTQGRCGHCIRLKKECSFIPTEQQQGPDARTRGPAPNQMEIRTAHGPSSPRPLGSANATESMPPHFTPLVTNAPPISSPPTSAPATALGILPSNGVQAYDLNQNSAGWVPQNVNYFDGNQTNWANSFRPRPDVDSPMSEHGPEQPLSATWTGLPNMGSRGFPWAPSVPAQGRSMSYSGESMGGQSPAPYAMMSQGGVVEGQGAPWAFPPPMPVAGRGEPYPQGMSATEGQMPPLGVASPPDMQWQQQHQGFHGVQDPFGNWIPDGPAAQQIPPSDSEHMMPPEDPTEPRAGGPQ